MVNTKENISQYREEVLSKINSMDMINDELVLEKIEHLVYQQMLYEPIDAKEKVIFSLFNEFRRLGKLQPLLEDDDITEIMINGINQIYIEKKGQMQQIDLQFESRDELFLIVQKIVSQMDRKVNEKHPICDVRLPDGSRVNIVLNPVAIEGPCVTIRKFPNEKLTRDHIIRNSTIDEEPMAFLEKLIQKKYNVFISGGTSSGKTTLLNILSDAIDERERIITIEDSAELKIKKGQNLVRLEARNTKDSYNNNVSIRELIKTALRMRPDRIIVGEVRGEETIDMLQGMNTGHSGSVSTGHSNTTKDMLFRLETMVLSGMDIPLKAIRQQIASALDILVHIQKISGKGRRIVEISEVIGMERDQVKIEPLYRYDEKKDCLVRTSHKLLHQEKLLWN